jgi:hypothetical protein
MGPLAPAEPAGSRAPRNLLLTWPNLLSGEAAFITGLGLAIDGGAPLKGFRGPVGYPRRAWLVGAVSRPSLN